MTISEAQQIADLINSRNRLDNNYNAERVARDAALYEYEVVQGKVAACVQRKELQWYQWEILHLSVCKEHEREGLAYRVYKRAEEKAIANNVRLLQCTIREGNEESERFFGRQGFVKVNRFKNQRTDNIVGVWQKVLSPTGENH
jgi:ribosomal protein S18 acetylase RimI-like enzyme